MLHTKKTAKMTQFSFVHGLFSISIVYLMKPAGFIDYRTALFQKELIAQEHNAKTQKSNKQDT